MANRRGKSANSDRYFIFLGSKITADGNCSHEIKDTSRRKTMTNLDSILKSRDITLPTKVHTVKVMVFPVVIAWMWEMAHKESWVPENWCFGIVVLEKTLENPLESRRSNQSILKKINHEYSLEWLKLNRVRVNLLEAPIHWPSDAKSWFTEKDPDAGRDWVQGEKGTAEDEMVEWYHQPNGHDSKQTAGHSEEQGSLASCSPRGHKE